MKATIGGYPPGGHRMADGREIKPGDLVECKEEELGGAIDKFEVVEPDPEKTPIPKAGLQVVAREDGAGYDVINEITGQPINSVGLDLEEAYKLADQPVPKGEHANSEKPKPPTEGGQNNDDTGPQAAQAILEMRQRPGTSWYDIIEVATGGTINDKALKKVDAEELLANFEAELAGGADPAALIAKLKSDGDE